jgi:hypothetical protein
LIEQDAPGAVFAVSVAFAPGLTGLVTEVISRLNAAGVEEGGVVAVNDGVAGVAVVVAGGTVGNRGNVDDVAAAGGPLGCPLRGDIW